MLEQVCDFVHNYFTRDVYVGEFTISDGIVLLPGLLDGQRFRIIGSALNDGMYTYHTDGVVYDDDGLVAVPLADETFNGMIATMAVPRGFERLVADIAAWQAKNQDVLDSPYTSESFGGYSYTKATGSGSNSGGALSWQDVFRTKLNAYRKIA